MNKSITVANRVFWVVIKVYEGEYPVSPVKYSYTWRGPWHVRTKWSWYFEYRAALYKVQNPRCLVEFFWDSEAPDTRTRIDFVKQEITTKRRMISKLTNELDKYKEYLLSHNIFGLEGDDGRIHKAEMKISKYKMELQSLEKELEKINLII